MPKPSWVGKESKSAALPEIFDVEIEEKEKVLAEKLLEEGRILKARLNKDVSDEEYEPDLHLARRYEEIKQELNMIQQSNNLDGLRVGKVAFVSRLQDGKRSIDMKKYTESLLGSGVKLNVIQQAEKDAEKIGDSFWVKEIKELK